MQREYWPFPVIPPDQRTAAQASEIDFLERAYALGYQPFVEGLDYCASNGDGRLGHIVRRARAGRWEVIFGDESTKLAWAYLDDFDCAATAILHWLGGGEIARVMKICEPHLVVLPGASKASGGEWERRRSGDALGSG